MFVLSLNKYVTDDVMESKAKLIKDVIFENILEELEPISPVNISGNKTLYDKRNFLYFFKEFKIFIKMIMLFWSLFLK